MYGVITQLPQYNPEHFWQGGPEFKYVRDRFRNFGGVCWFSCLAMAAQALYPDYNLRTWIDKLWPATFELREKDVAEILELVREDGFDTSPFFYRGEFRFINNGGLSCNMRRNYPEMMNSLFNHILEKHKLPIHLTYQALETVDAKLIPDIFDVIACSLYYAQLPAFEGYIFKNGHYSANHMFLVTGMDQTTVTIADPNRSTAIKVNKDFIYAAIKRPMPYRDGIAIALDSSMGVTCIGASRNRGK